MKDLKIVNANIPCFETKSFNQADILVDHGTIVKIGSVSEDTENTIDAGGKIVSPGFIDIHAHEDPVHAGQYKFFNADRELLMGVTTKVAGNCGINYDNLPDFCENIEKGGSPTNYMMFMGQNYLRERVGASDRYRPATKAQMEHMKQIIREEGRQWSPAGLSCGFEYAPGVTEEETIELLSAFANEDCLMSVHYREDSENGVKSIEEVLRISRASGCRVQFSHIGSCSALGYMKESLLVIDKAIEEGIDIMADCYPYAAFCTGIGTAVFDEGCFEKWGKTYEDILVTAGTYKNQRCTKEIFEKVRRETPDINVVAFVMNEEEVIEAYRKPYVMAGSDSIFVNGGGHPRGAGTFPRILGRYVRQQGALTLMEALEKMTILPAKRMGLASKGEIKEGLDADLVIFDENTIIDKADFENPAEPPDGIDFVLINGQIAVKGQKIVNGRLGTYIKSKKEGKK